MSGEERIVALELFQDHFRACVMQVGFETLHPQDHRGFIMNGETGIKGGSWDFAKMVKEMERSKEGKDQFQNKITTVLGLLVAADKGAANGAPVDPHLVTKVGVAVTGTMYQNKMYILDDGSRGVAEDDFYAPLQAAITSIFPRASIYVRNRSQLGALGEIHLTQNAVSEMVYITVSHGIGTGIITKGELLEGTNKLAGISGHLVVSQVGEECAFCHRIGCLTKTASGTAMATAAVKAMTDQSIPALLNEAKNPTDKEPWLRDAGGTVPFKEGNSMYAITGRSVLLAARTADPSSEVYKIVSRSAESLMQGIVTLINIFDPQLIILGGIAPYNDVLLSTIRRNISPFLFEEQIAIRINPSWLSDRAALMGAGYYALIN